MSERKEAVSLGEVVRYMATQALASDTKSFAVPLRMIVQQVYGLDRVEMMSVYEQDVATDGKYHLKKLKASYVSNTVSRMPEAKAANVRSMFSLKDMEFNGEETKCAVISLVPGAINIGSRSKADAEKEAAAVERFKTRLLKISPNILDLQGEQQEGALIALARYQDMIKETK